MKIFRVVLISFAILITIVILAGAIFIATFDVNRFKPQIIAQASKVLNRNVDFSKANLTLRSSGVVLQISGLTVSDNPDFSKESFLTVKEFSLGFDILRYLFQKEIDISDITIDSPKVTIIRLKDGRINAQSIAAPKEVPQAGVLEQSVKENAPPSQSNGSVQMPATLISSLKCNNGSLAYIDYSFEPPLTIEVYDLSLSGSGITNKISVFDKASAKAKLKNINLLRMVLDKISVIPGLSDKIEAGLSDRFKQKLSETDTVLSDIKLPFTLENGKIAVKEAVLGADEFSLQGSADASFDGAYSLEGTFLITQELSNAMVGAVPELQYILNSDKEIYIPLKVSGKAGELKLKVDAQYMAKKILANQAKQQLFKAIEKAIGKKGSDNTNEQAGQSEEDQSNSSSIEEAVGGLLDKILKKK